MGISHQKLYGEGTVANNQLNELKDINTNTDHIEPLLTMINGHLSDLKNSLQGPDLKAWFVNLFPGLPIIPYYRSIRGIDPVDATVKQSLGKRVFAEVYMHASLSEVSAADNAKVGIVVQALLGNQVIHQVSAKVHGNDILVLPSESSSFVGIIDSYWFAKFGSSALSGDGSITIRGFAIPDDFDVDTLQDLPAQNPGGGSSDNGVLYLYVNDLEENAGVQEYSDVTLAGQSFALYYHQGGNFLIPDEDFEYLPGGGFKLTGFPNIGEGQTLILIP